MKHLKGLLLLVLVGLGLSACATIYQDGVLFDQVAQPDKSMATIYFYRDTDVSGVPSLDVIKVANNHKEFGELYRGGYFIHKVEPGRYKFHTEIKGTVLDKVLELDVEANQIYFLKSVFTSKFMSNVNHLEIIPKDLAIDELKDYRLQIDSR